MKENWGVDKLRRHYDLVGKECPRIMSANNWKEWDRFKFNVNKELIFLKQWRKRSWKIKINLVNGLKRNGMA